MDLAHREHRQRDGAEIERHEIIILEAVAEDIEPQGTDAGEERRGDETLDTAAEENAAERRLVAPLDIFGHEADQRRLESEAGEPAEDDRADPDDGEDAVFEIAHPARQQDLADIGDGGREDTDDEGDQRDAPRDGDVVASVERRVDKLGHRHRLPGQAGGQACRNPRKRKPHRTPPEPSEPATASGRPS
jgi:hypothetical protein